MRFTAVNLTDARHKSVSIVVEHVTSLYTLHAEDGFDPRDGWVGVTNVVGESYSFQVNPDEGMSFTLCGVGEIRVDPQPGQSPVTFLGNVFAAAVDHRIAYVHGVQLEVAIAKQQQLQARPGRIVAPTVVPRG